MGITLFAFVYGNVPFYDENIVALYNKIRNQSVEFPETPPITEKLKKLIRKMLIKDPSQRITLPEIKVCTYLANTKKMSLCERTFFRRKICG